jgi:hypothetical protein
MIRKNLLMACGLISVTLVLAIAAFIIFSTITDTSIDASNSITGNNNSDSDEYLSFDNSTPEATAISIARLCCGVGGFYTCHTFNTSLTIDGKYWIVKMDDSMIVTVNAKTLMSKQNGDLNQPANTWRSLNELKAQYIADIHSECLSENARVGKPSKVTIDGKKIWKVPVYYYNDVDHKITEYVYVDLVTGKSKNTWNDFNELTWTKEWLTLKEMDDRSGLWPSPFKDALRNLYPE